VFIEQGNHLFLIERKRQVSERRNRFLYKLFIDVIKVKEGKFESKIMGNC
jgi:hypothetical protein